MGPFIPNLINAGAQIIGANRSDDAARRSTAEANEFTAHQANLDRRLQREFAQYGVRWRVADARAAGLHPLAALGIQTNAATPAGQMGQASSGSAKGDAIRAAGAALAESLARADRDKAEVRLLNAQADVTEQQYRESVASRATQGISNDVSVPEFHDVKNPQFTPHVKIGAMLDSAPWISDAQTIEDRYGELAGALSGAVILPSDVLYTAGKKASAAAKAFKFNKPYIDFESIRYQ